MGDETSFEPSGNTSLGSAARRNRILRLKCTKVCGYGALLSIENSSVYCRVLLVDYVFTTVLVFVPFLCFKWRSRYAIGFIFSFFISLSLFVTIA